MQLLLENLCEVCAKSPVAVELEKFLTIQWLWNKHELTYCGRNTPHSYQRLQTCEWRVLSPAIFHFHVYSTARGYPCTLKSKLSRTQRFSHVIWRRFIIHTVVFVNFQHNTSLALTYFPPWTQFWNEFPLEWTILLFPRIGKKRFCVFNINIQFVQLT